MKIDSLCLHTRYQQIAMLDDETGELVECRPEHSNGEARSSPRSIIGPVRVGIEATGHTHWFERLLEQLGHELWIGDAARCIEFVEWDSGELVSLYRPRIRSRDGALLLSRQILRWLNRQVLE